jgi:hypothetical protein
MVTVGFRGLARPRVPPKRKVTTSMGVEGKCMMKVFKYERVHAVLVNASVSLFVYVPVEALTGSGETCENH